MGWSFGGQSSGRFGSGLGFGIGSPVDGSIGLSSCIGLLESFLPCPFVDLANFVRIGFLPRAVVLVVTPSAASQAVFPAPIASALDIKFVFVEDLLAPLAG